MCPNPQFPTDWVTFTKKFLMRNFIFSAVKLTGSIISFKVPFQRATEEYNIVLSAQFEKFEYESF